ncbi:MAG: hypothetical protein OJF50_002268 [Nitrospira sp.]|nr:hypothetical protein [Nitrospira sp.]
MQIVIRNSTIESQLSPDHTQYLTFGMVVCFNN